MPQKHHLICQEPRHKPPARHRKPTAWSQTDPRGDAIAIWDRVEGDGSEAPSNIAINRFDRVTGTWASAVLIEGQADIAFSSRRPSASASGGQALLGWIQAEGGVNRVKALLQPLTDTPSR